MTHRSDQDLALAHVFLTSRITVNFWVTHQSPRAAITDHQNWGLKQQKWILSVLETRSLGPRGQGTALPLKAPGRLSLAASSSGKVPGHPGHSLACRRIAPTSLPLWLRGFSTCLCPHVSFLTRTPVTALGTTLLYYVLILTQLPQRRPNKSCS